MSSTTLNLKKNVKGSFSDKGEMISDGNLHLQEGIKSSRNAQYIKKKTKTENPQKNKKNPKKLNIFKEKIWDIASASHKMKSLI